MDKPRKILVLGSTGSVGQSSLSAIEMLGEGYRVEGLMARSNHEIMLEQAARARPRALVMTEKDACAELDSKFDARGLGVSLTHEESEVNDLIRDAGITDVIVALPGVIGLPFTLLALECGKRVLLANKESLVVGGALILAAIERSGAELIPIDSEHNALYQLLGGAPAGRNFPESVRSIVLTASGGPFRSFSPAQLESVTPEQACNHPVWAMGRKISVDSATLMNKGLEMIEAHWLFGAPPEKIRVVIHPQSVVHAIVEYVDGNSVAHMGTPDMRLPIASALAHPDRIESGLKPPDWCGLGTLSFEEPRTTHFPCLALAYESLRIGRGAPATLNAANEVAVERFLRGEIGFTRIPNLVEHVLKTCDHDDGSYEALMKTDCSARQLASQVTV